MYVSMKEMLQKPIEKTMRLWRSIVLIWKPQAVIDAAAESHAPIIVDLLQDHLKPIWIIVT